MKSRFNRLPNVADGQDLDADIEQPSDASYLSLSPNTTPTRTTDVFPMATSPTTPSTVPRGTHEIEALSDLMDAMTRERGDLLLETHMDLEEEEEEGRDLDADVEDMDDEEELESSFIESDSMELQMI